MKKIIDFVKTTAFGGLLVIIPFTIILLVLAQLLAALYQVGQQLADALPIAILDNATVILTLTLASIVGLCFVTGLMLRTRIGMAIRDGFNRYIGSRIPMYNAISSLTHRFIGVEGEQFAPVEVDLYGSSSRVLGFLVEELPDARCAVFVPSAPVATVGGIYVVPRACAVPLQTSTGSALTVITQWGVDSATLYGAESQNGP